jgi:hypothetical protein
LASRAEQNALFLEEPVMPLRNRVETVPAGVAVLRQRDPQAAADLLSLVYDEHLGSCSASSLWPQGGI